MDNNLNQALKININQTFLSRNRSIDSEIDEKLCNKLNGVMLVIDNIAIKTALSYREKNVHALLNNLDANMKKISIVRKEYRENLFTVEKSETDQKADKILNEQLRNVYEDIKQNNEKDKLDERYITTIHALATIFEDFNAYMAMLNIRERSE